MEVAVLGDPDGGPAVVLDHEAFAYAGKFRMTTTGKVLASENDEVVGAIAFNRDRTTPGVVWFRYLTVRGDYRGTGVGARLAARAVDRIDADAFRIAVNNPYAYEAMYKAGFGYTGTETGVAELVLAYPSERSPCAYQSGFAVFTQRESLSDAERAFIDARSPSPPPVVEG